MTQTLSSGCCTNTRTSRCNHRSLSYSVYTARIFIIVMISDSYYLVAIQLCFCVWLRMTTFN